MQDKQPFARVIITIIFSCLGNLFGALMYPRLSIALADLPFILRVFVGSFMTFFMFLGVERFVWGIVVLLQRTRPQLYEFLVAKIFGPKQLIFIGAAILAIPFQIGILIIFFSFVIMLLGIIFPISVQFPWEFLLSVFNILSLIFKNETVALYCAFYTIAISLSLILNGNEQLKAKEQNQYYGSQVMYPPISQQR